MRVLERQNNRLNPRAGDCPVRCSRQLPAPQLLGHQRGGAFLRQRNVEHGREQGGILDRVELDLCQRTLQVAEAPLRRHIGAAEALPTPLGNRVHRRILQELRAGPFGPSMRHLAQQDMKFFDQTGFADSRLAND